MATQQSFERLIDAFNEARGPERAQIEAQIEDLFAEDITVLDLDMAGFTRLTTKHGVIHYLAMVRRMNVLAEQMIGDHDGSILKFEADNLFATFPAVDNALQFALDMQTGLQGMNITTDDESDIHVAIGIASGRTLVIEGRDAWGGAMNLASRLGEDIGKPGEILVCAKSFEARTDQDAYAFETRVINDKGNVVPIVSVENRVY